MRQAEKRARRRERARKASATARAEGGSERVSASEGGSECVSASEGGSGVCGSLRSVGAWVMGLWIPESAGVRRARPDLVFDAERYCERAPTHYVYHSLSDNGFPRTKSGEAHDGTDTCKS